MTESKVVKVSEDSVKKLEQMQEQSLGQPTLKSLVDEAVAQFNESD